MFRGGGTRTSSEGILQPPTHGTHACEHTHHHSSRAHGEGCGCHVPRTALRGPPHLIPTPPGTAHTAPASCPSRPASTQQPRPCRAWGTRAEPEQKKQGCSCETGLDGSWGEDHGAGNEASCLQPVHLPDGTKGAAPTSKAPARGWGELPVLFTILSTWGPLSSPQYLGPGSLLSRF